MLTRVIRFLFSIYEFIILVILSTISFLILLKNDAPPIRSLQGSVADVLSFVHYPQIWINDLSGLIKENRQLKEENLQLRLLNATLKEAYLENQRLRAILNFLDTTKLDIVPAEVINQGVTPLFNSILINVGKKDGVEPNMAVISLKGIVGKTVSVGANTSVVQIFLDVNFRLGVKLESSRVYGIMQWNPDGYGEIKEIPKNVFIYKGEKVYSSGYSEIYPPNILVGEVIDIYQSPTGLYQTAKVRPVVDISSLEEVFVIRNKRWFVKPS